MRHQFADLRPDRRLDLGGGGGGLSDRRAPGADRRRSADVPVVLLLLGARQCSGASARADFGSSSTLALHRIAPENSSQAGTALDAEEFYDHPDPGCLYVENMNRWVSRTLPGSNNTLAALAPDGFTHSHLPRVPNRYSVRTPVGRAREAASFMPDACADLALQDGQFCFDYQLDLVRDINGAGLIYFAAYFAIFDTALLQWWRSLGRADAQFSRRRVVQQRVGFFGNADPGAKCVITVQNWVNPTGGQEVADMAMHDASTGRLLAVTAIELGGR